MLRLGAHGVQPRCTLVRPLVPIRTVTRASKVAKLIKRDRPPFFSPSGKRIFNPVRHLFNLNKKINWAACFGTPQDAVKLFAELKTSGVAPDIVTYTSLLKAFVRGKQWAEVDTTFNSLSQVNLKPNGYTYAHMLDALGQQGATERITQLVEKAKAELPGDEDLYRQTMLAYGAAKALPEVNKTWAELKAVKTPARFSWNAYLQALARACDVAGALAAFQDLGRQPRLRADRQSYLHVVSALAQGATDPKHMQQALELVAQMRVRRIAVTGPVYHELIKGWANLGQMDKAVGVVADMRRNSVVVSPQTYHLLVEGFIKNKQLPKADLQLFEMTAEAHLRPLAQTLTALAAAHASAGNAKRGQEVSKLLDEYKWTAPAAAAAPTKPPTVAAAAK